MILYHTVYGEFLCTAEMIDISGSTGVVAGSVASQ